MFPNSRKLRDKGFVKSSSILIGRKIGVGEMYLAKTLTLFYLTQHKNNLMKLVMIMLR